MTCDERLEQTLNRAGQTFDESRDYTKSEIYSAMRTPFLELVMKYLECVRLIDTMETALENVCGERDYLRYWISKDSVKKVICEQCPNGIDCGYKDDACKWCDYMKDGVPEYWRADDGKTD